MNFVDELSVFLRLEIYIPCTNIQYIKPLIDCTPMVKCISLYNFATAKVFILCKWDQGSIHSFVRRYVRISMLARSSHSTLEAPIIWIVPMKATSNWEICQHVCIWNWSVTKGCETWICVTTVCKTSQKMLVNKWSEHFNGYNVEKPPTTQHTIFINTATKIAFSPLQWICRQDKWTQ